MTPDQQADLLKAILTFLGGGFAASIVAGIVALVRGRAGDKREDVKMRADISEKVTDMAGDMLDRARTELAALRTEVDELKADRERLEHAERRLTDVEAENASLREEVNTLKAAAVLELEQRQQMIDHVSAVHDWIEGGAKPPPPTRPAWAPRRHHIS